MSAWCLAFALPCAAAAQPAARPFAGRAREQPPTLAIAAQPIARFGGLRDDPREELGSDAEVLDVQQLRDGRWLVTDRTHLKVYTASGRLERVVGRTGSGPGEFRHVRAACVLPDGRWQVLDRQQRRLSRFGPDGQHLETRAVASSVEYDGCYGDGSLLVRDPPEALRRAFDRGESPARREYRTLFRRIQPDGRTVARIDSLPFETFAVLRRFVNAVVRRDTLYFAESHTAEVRVYAPDGRLVRRLTWTTPARPVTEALVRAQGAGRGPRTVGGDEVRAPVVDLAAEPRTVPPLGHLKVGADGTVWVSSYPLRGEARTWRVFGSDGAELGRFTVPTLPGFTDVRVVRGERESVVLRAVDGDGAVHLLVYPLRRW